MDRDPDDGSVKTELKGLKRRAPPSLSLPGPSPGPRPTSGRIPTPCQSRAPCGARSHAEEVVSGKDTSPFQEGSGSEGRTSGLKVVLSLDRDPTLRSGSSLVEKHPFTNELRKRHERGQEPTYQSLEGYSYRVRVGSSPRLCESQQSPVVSDHLSSIMVEPFRRTDFSLH